MLQKDEKKPTNKQKTVRKISNNIDNEKICK